FTASAKPGGSAFGPWSVQLLDRPGLQSRALRVRKRRAACPQQQRGWRFDGGDQAAAGQMAGGACRLRENQQARSTESKHSQESPFYLHRDAEMAGSGEGGRANARDGAG